MAQVALKVVEKPSFYELELELPSVGVEEHHSLHYALSYPNMTAPGLTSRLLQQFSSKGDVVLDPFCGSGTTPLESCLLGRIPYFSDSNPLAVDVSRAKVAPADLAEVALSTQMLDLQRPVDCKPYEKYFSPFYDVNTYRELFNARRALSSSSYDRLKNYMQLLVLGLMHGTHAGCLSVYSPGDRCLAPAEQEELNVRRRQIPDYRSLAPRLLRRSAVLLRDGFSRVQRQMSEQARSSVCDARNLSFLSSSSVDLYLASPPKPQESSWLSRIWLELWFSELSVSETEKGQLFGMKVSEWETFMNEVLLEGARVVRPGGKALIVCNDNGKSSWSMREGIEAIIGEHLAGYWEAEGFLGVTSQNERTATGHTKKKTGRYEEASGVLVLRRN